MANKPRQYKFDYQAGAIEDGYTRIEIIGGVATITTDAEAKLAERYGGRLVVANVVEKKSTPKQDKKGDKQL